MNVIVGIAHRPFVESRELQLAKRLCQELRVLGHRTEILGLPQLDHREGVARADEVLANRLLGVGSSHPGYDERYVALEPTAALLHHPWKTVWIASASSLPSSDAGPAAEADRQLREDCEGALRCALGEARRVLTRSLSAALELRDRHGIDAQILYPPASLQEVAPRRGPKNVIAAAIVADDVRGQVRRLLAAQKMVSNLRIVFLDLDGVGIGDGVADALRHDGGNRCAWVDGRPSPHVADTVCRARAMVLLGRDERPDLPLLAMGSGVPLIADRRSGVAAELVQHGVNGWLVDNADDTLEEALAAAWEGDAAASSMGTAARHLYRRIVLPWSTVVENLLG